MLWRHLGGNTVGKSDWLSCCPFSSLHSTTVCCVVWACPCPKHFLWNVVSRVLIRQLCHLGWWVGWALGYFFTWGWDLPTGMGKFCGGRGGNQTSQCNVERGNVELWCWCGKLVVIIIIIGVYDYGCILPNAARPSNSRLPNQKWTKTSFI